MHGGIHGWPTGAPQENLKVWKKSTTLYEKLMQEKWRVRERKRARAPVAPVDSKGNKFFYRSGETFGPVDSSIRVQLVSRLFWQDSEKPRGGSRGAVTRSLSGRSSRKKRCLHGRDYSSSACVSTLSNQWQPALQLARSRYTGH